MYTKCDRDMGPSQVSGAASFPSQTRCPGGGLLGLFFFTVKWKVPFCLPWKIPPEDAKRGCDLQWLFKVCISMRIFGNGYFR